ncbi:MAG: hypothetical protein ACK57A_10280 [Gemmatimonas sp.]|uniref:hypothetical protein n=1 Tax=Gemmatimonas sp. TaxID=1962908 RepID=UPI00391F3A8D
MTIRIPRRALIALAALPLVAFSTIRAAFDLTGTWTFAVVTANGTGSPTVTLTQRGDTLTGPYASGRMGVIPLGGTVKDSTFTFAVNTTCGATLTFKGKIVDADHVQGDVDFGDQGGATFSGERKK